MTGRLLRSSTGFTYLAAIVMVVILGIMLAKGAVYWTTVMQRERETELIYRGTQYQKALRRWYKLTPVSGTTTQPMAIPPGVAGPREFKDLLMDPRSLTKLRYLRTLYPDPMTGKEFVAIMEGGKMVGVRSASEAEPIKQDFRFDFDLEPNDFRNKKKYSEWLFYCNHWRKTGDLGTTGGGVTGLPTTGPDGKSTSTSTGPAGGTGNTGQGPTGAGTAGGRTTGP